MRVYVEDGGSDRLHQQMFSLSMNVVAIAEEVRFAYESLSKARPLLAREEVRGAVEGENVGVSRYIVSFQDIYFK